MALRFSSHLLLLLILAIALNHSASTQTPSELATLQNEFAVNYLEPESHMALAKYYLARGDRREAFFILEVARRGILEEKVFDRAFQVAFEGFDNSKSAEQKLLSQLAENPHSADVQFKLADIYISRSDYTKAKQILVPGMKEHAEDFRFTAGLAGILQIEGKSEEAARIVQQYAARYPESGVGYVLRAEALHKTNPQSAKLLLEQGAAKYPTNGDLVFRLAAIIQETRDLDKAEALFERAASLAPKSVQIQSWVGRFFFKVRNSGDKALPYYLNAYFLSPHAYETEFVESRIRNIYFAQAQTAFQKEIRLRKSLVELLNNPNPAIVSMALQQMHEEWKPTYVDPVTALMGHEDQGVRWEATQLLKKKVASSFDARLRDLLKDRDLRVRGLAAYIAVYRWRTASFVLMDELLSDRAQLLRFDALSALILEGGQEGKQRALAHDAKETHPTLKKLLEATRAK
jgi:tetratricopeptide (TPR) repeat protein